MVDFLLARPDVDPARIVLYGISQGGCWVPRALAFEHRVAAAVAGPGVHDAFEPWWTALPPELRRLLDRGEKDEFDRLMDEGMAAATPAQRQNWSGGRRPHVWTGTANRWLDRCWSSACSTGSTRRWTCGDAGVGPVPRRSALLRLAVSARAGKHRTGRRREDPFVPVPARRGRGGPLLLALVLAAALAGCADGSGGGITVRAAQFPWSAAKLTNAILAEVTAGHPELGVGRIKSVQVGPATAWAGARRGDVDLLSEVAMPNQEELAAKAADRIELVHETYGDARQGWFVPTYATGPGRPLAGLRSVTQLNDYAAALDGKLIDADPSFITTEQNAKRLAGYGLNLEQVASSEAAQLAELRRAYERRQPILVYLYHPHWAFEEFELTQLEEPTDFQPDCFTTGNGACAMPDYAAWTATSKELAQEAPRFHAMLQRFELPLTDVEAMLKSVDVDNADVEEVARQWVAEHPDLVGEWVGP
ncbi:glycine betaine ABC transporter substrate-binding protein [Pseudonocardia sp. H11422]|uniref:glycine betaine ABC transporter substrate-binding protein n=1 Tax=Pseudonocardia sp. H11422 TaxID=2835866 RepID=UPI0027E2C300|nr:glycine betaine ABC transporter substrate-binding protein [Pseudonocardia sp. H11422]